MLSLAHATIMGWAFASVQMSKQPSTAHIVNQIDTAWLVHGLISFGFAVAALVADSDRRAAIFAMIVSIAVSLICGIPLMVSANGQPRVGTVTLCVLCGKAFDFDLGQTTNDQRRFFSLRPINLRPL
jgi:hypothetical protein